VKVVALLNWYEEHPGWLVECVASASRLCDHIVAVDGAYGAFPGALKKPYSGAEQADAILRTAAGLGIGCTLHQSRQIWWGGQYGGEVEKRDFMFRLAEQFTTSDDWYFRIDSDELLTQVPEDTKQRLATTKRDVAEIMLWQRLSTHVDAEDGESPFRCLFRALPGLGIQQTHYMVVAPPDRVLNGPGQESAEILWDVKLEHRSHLRTATRQRLKQTYNSMIDSFEKVDNEQ
jgi:hypothetical protein